VYSLSAIVGGNGVGKSTVLRFILDAVVEGAANQDLQGCIIFEKDGNLYKCTRNCELNIIGISNVKIIKTDNESINTFFYSGHFSPLFDYNDVRTVELTGMYNATDNFRLIKDLQDYSNVDTIHLSNNIQSHFFAFSISLVSSFASVTAILMTMPIKPTTANPITPKIISTTLLF
jgi:ABC-type molybdenum transport system ATPase subunit/photorepair protein PhrA